MPKWDDMSEDERYAYLKSRLAHGDLEIVYARLGPGVYYITLKAPYLCPEDHSVTEVAES